MSLFPVGWLVCWREGDRRRCQELPTEAEARRCAFCLSVLLPVGRTVKVVSPEGETVETLKWAKRAKKARKPVEAMA